MKIATEQRSDKWLAQVVHIGEGLSWREQSHIQKELHDWVNQNCTSCHYNNWQFWFSDEPELTAFLLKWNESI